MLVGATISHYRILEWLGKGGMGVVYRAEDIRLHRHVALKFLTPELSRDPKALERFQLEARAASALNHPSICTIYDIGASKLEDPELDGGNHEPVHFMVMEFLEGQTLSTRLKTAPLELEEILDLGIQIADALDAAHSRNIIHRDIKPANIFVNKLGLAKILDFGLAKLMARESFEDVHEALTSGPSDLSKSASVMGTVAYMSPEQARGQTVDSRSDIFSFGMVLYEMATGRRTFSGATDAVVFDAILNKRPPSPLEFNEKLPQEFERIAMRTLEKDPELRYQSASDLRSDLKRLRRDSVSGLSIPAAPTQKPKPPSRNIPWLAPAVLIALAILAFFFIGRQFFQSGKEDVISEGAFTQLTDMTGMELQPSLSPSGDMFAYARNVAGNWDIFLQRVGGRNPINLTAASAADDWQPAFSADGQFIAFRSERDGGGIYVMGATGESTRRITDFGYTPSWSPGGTHVVVSTDMTNDPNGRGRYGELFTVDVQTGEKTLVAKNDAVQPTWSPHGHRIAYWAVSGEGAVRDLWTIPSAGGEPVAVTNDPSMEWSPAWAPDGKHLYFGSDRGGTMNLWRVAIDEQTGRIQGKPESMTTPSPFIGQFSVSADGKKIAFAAFERTSKIAMIPFDPVAEKPTGNAQHITLGTSKYISPDPSPDMQWLVFRSTTKEDLYISRADGSDLRQLTDDAAKDRGPKWSPDGKQIAFYSDRGGKYGIWTIHPDGSNLKQLLDPSQELWWPLWSPDGKQMIASNDKNCFLYDLSSPGQPKEILPPLNAQKDAFIAHSWSPDGKWLTGGILGADGNSQPGNVVYSFQSKVFEQVTPFGNLIIAGSVWWSFPKWLSDSRRILFQSGDGVWIVDRQTKRTNRVLTLPTGINIAVPQPSINDRTIFYTEDSQQSDIWLRSATTKN